MGQGSRFDYRNLEVHELAFVKFAKANFILCHHSAKSFKYFFKVQIFFN